MVMMDLDDLLEQGGCAKCGAAMQERLVVERVLIGTAGEFFEVEVPLVECLACGVSHTDERAEALRHDAACKFEGLLTPSEIRAIRAKLGMSRRVFDAAYGIPPASMERWENGRLLQNRSLDTLLRALQNPVTANRLDRRAQVEQSLGQVILGRFGALERNPSTFASARKRAAEFHPRRSA